MPNAEQPAHTRLSLRDAAKLISSERDEIDAAVFASAVQKTLAGVRRSATVRFAESMRFSTADVSDLWGAADRFCDGISHLAESSVRTLKTENTRSFQPSWPAQTLLAPWGNILLCLPANAVIPLAIILPVSLIAAGNSLLVAVSNASRDVGLSILQSIERVVPNRLVVWGGSVREAVGMLTSEQPCIDALYFIGGSKQYPEVATLCAQRGVALMYEGEGRSLAIVDETLKPGEIRAAVKHLVASKAFCNGKMCSAPNAVLVCKDVLEGFQKAYYEECIATRLNGPIRSILDDGTMSLLERVVAQLGDTRPSIVDNEAQHPFFWQTEDNSVLPEWELFCPGIYIIPKQDYHACIEFAAASRFKLQVVLYSNERQRLQLLIKKTCFARYCVWMNPANQDAMLPWGGYGCSGHSDVLDFYRKGFRRVTVEGQF